jgi:hypothetical protein
MEIECFPSWIQEGWIRPQLSLISLSTGGDGVVKANSEWLLSTTSPKSMSLKCQNKTLNHMDLGTPPEPGGEMIGSLMKMSYKRKIRNQKINVQYPITNNEFPGLVPPALHHRQIFLHAIQRRKALV